MRLLSRTLVAAAGSCLVAASAIACEDHAPSLLPPGDARAKADDVAVQADLEHILFDPSSAIRKMVRGPRAGSIKEIFSDRWTGDIVCYSINAKNRFGGYVGAQLYVFVVSGGVVTKRFAEEDESYIVADECKLPADDPVSAVTAGARP